MNKSVTKLIKTNLKSFNNIILVGQRQLGKKYEKCQQKVFLIITKTI
jgi:hypothetical protein